jgi:glycine/D-amino acid oxidase-like deaminating enzyme
LRGAARALGQIHSAAAEARGGASPIGRRGASVDYLDRATVAAIAGTDIYRGVRRPARGCYSRCRMRGSWRRQRSPRARVHRGARVVRLERAHGGFRAVTATGASVDAEIVLKATNAYAEDLVPGLARSIVALNSLQIATAPIPPALRATLLPNGETLSDTRRVIRYWRLDDAGRLLMGGRGPYGNADRASDWNHLAQDVRRHYPSLDAIAFTHRWGGRVAVHVDYLPRLHRPQPGLFVAIGCQGRGVAWQSAMGAELARLATDARYDPVLPITAVRPIPFHPLKAAGVAATIAAYRVLDRWGTA